MTVSLLNVSERDRVYMDLHQIIYCQQSKNYNAVLAIIKLIKIKIKEIFYECFSHVLSFDFWTLNYNFSRDNKL